MDITANLAGRRRRSERGLHLEILPLLLPPDWSAGSELPLARRLIGTEGQRELDPWVAINLASPDRRQIQLLPRGAFHAVSETSEIGVTVEDVEQMACLCLDELMRREDLQIGPFGGRDQHVHWLVYADYAASVILLPGLLNRVARVLGTDMLYIAIPTRSSILFTGDAASCHRMLAHAERVRSLVHEEAHVTRAIFTFANGRLEGMMPPVDAGSALSDT